MLLRHFIFLAAPTDNGNFWVKGLSHSSALMLRSSLSALILQSSSHISQSISSRAPYTNCLGSNKKHHVRLITFPIWPYRWQRLLPFVLRTSGQNRKWFLCQQLAKLQGFVPPGCPPCPWLQSSPSAISAGCPAGRAPSLAAHQQRTSIEVDTLVLTLNLWIQESISHYSSQ